MTVVVAAGSLSLFEEYFMADEKVSYDSLPECVKTGLRDRPDLASGYWGKSRIPLDKLSHILDVPAEDDDERQKTLRYKEAYLQRREVCPIVIEIIGGELWPADGRHRLTAYRMAVEEDNKLPERIECWVRIDMV